METCISPSSRYQYIVCSKELLSWWFGGSTIARIRATEITALMDRSSRSAVLPCLSVLTEKLVQSLDEHQSMCLTH